MNDPLVGSVLAGHRIVRLAGRGGMGVVYEAVEVALDRVVALKVITPELAADVEFRKRFVEESRVAASIDHPNVVPIFQAGEDGGRLFLAMRLVEGDDLATLVLRDGPLAPERAARIVAQVAAALDAAHGRSLVHRDIKPANVLIAAGDHAYLTDFGLAKHVAMAAGPTRTGIVVGTPDFLAPEQIRGEAIGPWTDIYALGCVLFFALTGRVVFPLDGPDAKLWAHLKNSPPSVTALRDGVPAALENIVRRALAKDPRDRFESATALGAALDAAVSEAHAVALAGRAPELARLHELWAAVGREGGGLRVFVTGASGIGKTRLATAFADEARRDGDVLFATDEAVVARAAHARHRSLLLVDDLDRCAAGLQAAVDGLALALVPVLVLATVQDEDAIPRRRSDTWLRLEGLDAAAVEQIAALYGQVDAARLLAASGGAPGRVHQLAREWARMEAAGRVEDSAARAAAGRRQWSGAETELAGNVLALQATRERAQLATGAAGTSPTCPFKGLASFDFDDAEYFFGRERLVAALVARIVGAPLLAIVGTSGSGKSSLLRAGLLPALAADVLPGSARWARVLIRPGEHPAHELRKARAYMRPDQPIVLAIDQFEETFTACRDEEERRTFVEGLERIARDLGERGAVIVAVRSDFYSRCAAYPELSDLMAANHAVVGPMRRAELRRAIEHPAARAGLHIEPELVDVLLADVESEPGALPLLSSALLELWQHRDGDWLRLATYEGIGGVSGAVARLAEAAFGRLDAAEQPVARRLLLRLADDSVGDVIVRRRVALTDLDAATVRVAGRLADRRLLAISIGSVEVAHEALLREWPRLRGWLEEDADARRLQRALAHAARAWDEHGRDSADLYRGARLAAALEWQEEHEFELNATERAFLDAARDVTRGEEAAAKRRTRRLRAVALGLAVLVLITGTSAVLAVRQTQRAEAERQTATSRSLAAQALGKLGDDPDVAGLVGLEAYRTEATFEARSAMSSILRGFAHSRGTLRGHRAIVKRIAQTGASTGVHLANVMTVAASPDGDTLVSAGVDETLRFWSARTRRQLGSPVKSRGEVVSAAFSADGKLLATGALDWRVSLWDPRTRRPLGELRTGDPIAADTGTPRGPPNVALSRDGNHVAAAGAGTTVRLWDLSRPRRPGRSLQGHTDVTIAVAFSPDGATLASAGADATIRLWDVSTRRSLGRPLRGHRDFINSLAFSADGAVLASAGDDSTIRLWDVATGRELGDPLTGHTGAVTSVAFSPDGTTLASGALDSSVRLWDLPTRRGLGDPLRGHRAFVHNVAFSADGSLVASAGDDGTVRLWDVDARGELGARHARHGDRVTALAISADGALLATAGHDGSLRLSDTRSRATGALSGNFAGSVTRLVFIPAGDTLASAGEDEAVRLWDTRTRRELGAPLRGHTLAGRPPRPPRRASARGLYSLGISANGTRLMSAGRDGAVRVWDPRTGRELQWREDPNGLMSTAAISPDGHTLATSGEDGLVRVWDLRDRGVARTFRAHETAVWSVAFSPDGTTLASTGDDQTVRLWDVRTGRSIGQPLTGHAEVVNDMAFSRDGSTLATASQDGTIRLWDVRTRRQLGQPLTGHTRSVTAVAFSADGRTLASASDDGTARVWRGILWNDSWTELRDLVCRAVNRNLSRAEWTEFLPGEPYRKTCPGR